MVSLALYRHPEDIPLSAPAAAVLGDLAWLAGAWVGTRGKSSIEERWSPPLGGAMLGVSRTVKGGAMVAFEYLRVVERDGGFFVQIGKPLGLLRPTPRRCGGLDVATFDPAATAGTRDGACTCGNAAG